MVNPELQRRRDIILGLLDLNANLPGVDQTQRTRAIKVLVGFEPGETKRFLKYVLNVVEKAIHDDRMRQFDEDN